MSTRTAIEDEVDSDESVGNDPDGGNLPAFAWPPVPWEHDERSEYGDGGVPLTFVPHPACPCTDCTTALSREITP